MISCDVSWLLQLLTLAEYALLLATLVWHKCSSLMEDLWAFQEAFLQSN